MNKTEFIMRQLSKTNKKNFENYVVTRIWNMINDTNIKFITQQYVKRLPEGRALTDMYFPQINLHVEVDEGHHFNQELGKVTHANGKYSYSVELDDIELTVGQSIIETYTATSADDTENKRFTVTIKGTKDGPTITTQNTIGTEEVSKTNKSLTISFNLSKRPDLNQGKNGFKVTFIKSTNPKKSQVNEDLIRDADILNATGAKPERIKVCGDSRYDLDINVINSNIDKVVKVIKDKFNTTPVKIWDIESEYNPQTYIDRGEISADEDVAFRYIYDACNCFGHSYKGPIQARGLVKHKIEDRMLWFPKLYLNEDWDNQLSVDEDTITMIKHEGNTEFFEKSINTEDDLKERLTFPKVRTNLGNVMYRFKGIYKVDIDESRKKGFFVLKRVSKTAKTYKPL